MSTTTSRISFYKMPVSEITVHKNRTCTSGFLDIIFEYFCPFAHFFSNYIWNFTFKQIRTLTAMKFFFLLLGQIISDTAIFTSRSQNARSKIITIIGHKIIVLIFLIILFCISKSSD